MALARTCPSVKPDYSPLREGRPSNRRAPRMMHLTQRAGRRLLRRSSRAPVLQGSREVHDLRSGHRAGARRRERHREEPRDHGRHRPEEGRTRARSAPISPTSIEENVVHGSDRAENAAQRDRLFLRRAETCARASAAARVRCRSHDRHPDLRRTNLLGLTRAELEAFVAGIGEKAVPGAPALKWLYKRGDARRRAR